MSMKTRARTDYIAVHCAATPPNLDIGRAEIDRWHRAKGWLMIGYHLVIRRDGRVETGRPIDAIGAHVKNYNHNSVGVCLVGGVDVHGKPDNNFTSAQWETLAVVLRDLKAKYPKAYVQGHRDFPNVHKACPSFDVRDWLAETRALETNQPRKSMKEDGAPPETGWKYHQIVAGDTFTSMSRKYGVSVDVIETLNPKVNPRRLKVGSSIRVN